MKSVFLFLVIVSVCFPFYVEAAEWSQDAGNAQRTGSTIENPLTPWVFLWSWNGPDAGGTAGNHFYNAPKEARTITGGSNIYVPAGSEGLYALDKQTGIQAWRINTTTFNAAPAYDETTGFVYAGGSNGQLYKINATSGESISYNAGNPLNKAVLLAGNFAYVVTDNGQLHKINTQTMANVWIYSANSTIATPPTYSISRDIIVYATDDLYVHAVNNSNGSQKWRVKPSPNTPGDSSISANQTVAGTPLGSQFELGWPVVAEQHGIVFVRMQLPHNSMGNYPSLNGIFPNDLTTTRTWLQNNPSNKNLFALSLDNGAEKFIPPVGYGSTEDFIATLNTAYGVMGGQPVVKVWPSGDEVAYIYFRNGQNSPPDYRWDGHMGEMVLDATTVSGFSPGDLRFMRTSRYNGYGGSGYDYIVDEQTPITVAGDVIFNSHWAAVTSHRITNRNSSFGLAYNNPIQTSKNPPIVRALFNNCNNKNTTTHYTTCTNLSYVTDGNGSGGRFFDGPGYWGYWGIVDPPGWRIGSGNTSGSAYSAGFLPRYTYVADGKIVVEGNGGELLVFSHSGTVPSPSPTQIPPSPTPTPKPGDVDGIGGVTLSDLTILLSNFGKSGMSRIQGDLTGDGSVTLPDLTQLLANFGK